MTLADRIRGVVRSVPAEASAEAERLAPRANRDHVVECLGGAWREWHGHSYLVVDRSYPPGHRHGDGCVVDSAPGDRSWSILSLLEPALADRDSKRVLFIDLETTGLAGGAGTYAFLVGCGWFEGATFRVRQFLLASFQAERGLLQELRDIGSGAGALATYNGKTFNLPLIEMRYLFHRLQTPFAGIPHLDMLHAARRLWGSGVRRPRAAAFPAGSANEEGSCRLSRIEQSVLGHVREGDVAGFEVPSRYFQYVRSGDARPLEAVLEHNRLDLLSLAMLTARAAQLLQQGVDAARTSREAIGLGRLYERRAMLVEARTSFARAADMPGTDALTHAEALRAYAVLSRRTRQFDDAAGAWRRILDLHPSQPHLIEEASQALAVYHEHRRREFDVARELTLHSLQFTSTESRREAAHHRLERLHRKIARDQSVPSSYVPARLL